MLIAAVAGCCLLETVLLLTVIGPADSVNWPSLAGRACIIASFFAIPLFGAFFSLLIHGRRRWLWRALVTLAIPTAIAAVTLAYAYIASLLPENDSVVEAYGWCGVALMAAALAVTWRITRRRAFRLDVEYWLALRSGSPDVLREHSRTVRNALWLPSATVLLVFTFFPQSWAFISHIHAGSGFTGAYKGSVPLTWIVAIRQDGLPAGLYWRRMSLFPNEGSEVHDFQLSGWSFASSAGTALRDGDAVLSEEAVPLADGSALCKHFQPEWDRNPDANFIYVSCTASGGFSASFDGNLGNLPAFYEVLRKVKKQK